MTPMKGSSYPLRGWIPQMEKGCSLASASVPVLWLPQLPLMMECQCGCLNKISPFLLKVFYQGNWKLNQHNMTVFFLNEQLLFTKAMPKRNANIHQTMKRLTTHVVIKNKQKQVTFYSSLSRKLNYRTSLWCQPRYSFSYRIYPEEVSRIQGFIHLFSQLFNQEDAMRSHRWGTSKLSSISHDFNPQLLLYLTASAKQRLLVFVLQAPFSQEWFPQPHLLHSTYNRTVFSMAANVYSGKC